MPGCARVTFTLTVPAWLAWAAGAGGYLGGIGLTRAVLAIVDDGPTYVPWLDTLLFAAAALLWPLTWALGIVVGLVSFVLRLVSP